MPGNIRRAEHFCSFLRQLVGYMRERISVQAVEQESCTTFLSALQAQMSVDGRRPLQPHMKIPLRDVLTEQLIQIDSCRALLARRCLTRKQKPCVSILAASRQAVSAG